MGGAKINYELRMENYECFLGGILTTDCADCAGKKRCFLGIFNRVVFAWDWL